MPGAIDVWMQHPTLRFLRHDMFASLRRWTGAAEAEQELPLSLTISAMDEGGVDRGLIAAWYGPDGPLISNDEVASFVAQAPDRLVVWEAQYGDFINGAQVVIDEFLLSARVKWGQKPSLVLLLPHGDEGQGPDHASARPERFLQLAADFNMRVANCTTAAQYFHLLRRQAALLVHDPLPLIVLTPKSLLRHRFVASAPRELAEGRWEPVIDDPRAHSRRARIRRLVLCTGKIAVDLETSDARSAGSSIAIARVEQLYPIPDAELSALIAGYRHVEEILWVQEEPENMGAWEFLRPTLIELAGNRPLRYVGRPRSSSPAEGSATRHIDQQQRIIADALRIPNPEPRIPTLSNV